MEIRHAISTDIPALMVMDHGYQTDHVWQMALNSSPTETTIAFREVRLPRLMRVGYPRDPARLADEWTNSSRSFVATPSRLRGASVTRSVTQPVSGAVPDSMIK